jgi:hypothetical protein
MTRAWLLRLRHVAIENIITLIRVVASCKGLGQIRGEGITETVIGYRKRNSCPIHLVPPNFTVFFMVKSSHSKLNFIILFLYFDEFELDR